MIVIVPSDERYIQQRQQISLALELARDDPEGIRIIPLYQGSIERANVPYGLRLKLGFSLAEMPVEAIAGRLGPLAHDLQEQELRKQDAKAQWHGIAPSTKRSKKRPARVFISYAHDDERLADEFFRHLSKLQAQGVIDAWHDRQIGAGDDWRGAISDSLKRADLILLLISANYLASDSCYDAEMNVALQKQARGEATVVAILLRSYDWTLSPFAKLQALPLDGRPITKQNNREQAWNETVFKIKRVVEN